MKIDLIKLDGSVFLIKYPELTEHFGDDSGKLSVVLSTEIQSRCANSDLFKEKFLSVLQSKNVSLSDCIVNDSEIRQYTSTVKLEVTFNYSDFIFRGDLNVNRH